MYVLLNYYSLKYFAIPSSARTHSKCLSEKVLKLLFIIPEMQRTQQPGADTQLVTGTRKVPDYNNYVCGSP